MDEYHILAAMYPTAIQVLTCWRGWAFSQVCDCSQAEDTHLLNLLQTSLSLLIFPSDIQDPAATNVVRYMHEGHMMKHVKAPVL